jgi:hypothetical protein
MKTKLQLCLFFAALGLGHLTTPLQAANEASPTTEAISNLVVTCEVRFIEAPRTEVNKLFSSTDYLLTAEQLRKLDELVNQKKASVLIQPRLNTISGTQAQVRGVREMIYPTEYGDPNAVSSDSTPSSSDVTGSNGVVQVTIHNNSAVSTGAARGSEKPAFAPKDFKT